MHQPQQILEQLVFGVFYARQPARLVAPLVTPTHAERRPARPSAQRRFLDAVRFDWR